MTPPRKLPYRTAPPETPPDQGLIGGDRAGRIFFVPEGKRLESHVMVVLPGRRLEFECACGLYSARFRPLGDVASANAECLERADEIIDRAAKVAPPSPPAVIRHSRRYPR